MTRTPDLFVGITTWNSALFLPHCLCAIRRHTPALETRVVVLDNASTDASTSIARELGAEVIVVRCTQADALNRLAARSRAPVTLLIHADVILLSPGWFDRCREALCDGVALVSPQDIGCGPMTRPFGRGMPESSFLFFDTRALRRCRTIRWRRRLRVPLPRRAVDFYGPHVSHHLPMRLAAIGKRWRAMEVHCSDRLEQPLFEPAFRPRVWNEELAHLRYGLGNFYSLGGEITHYHNWYDRIDQDVDERSTRTTERNGGGFPVAYIQAYTRAFLRDLEADRLVLPPPVPSGREPRAL